MAMKHLASDPERRAATAREIAERYDIPIELMAKVLTRLVRSGLLVSHQGLTAVTSSRSRLRRPRWRRSSKPSTAL